MSTRRSDFSRDHSTRTNPSWIHVQDRIRSASVERRPLAFPATWGGGILGTVGKIPTMRTQLRTAQPLLPSSLRLRPEILSARVGEELMLLDQRNGEYFALNSVGMAFWQGLERSPDIDQVFAELLVQFDVEPDELADDLASLIADLRARDLLAGS